jgi:transposase-like protein
MVRRRYSSEFKADAVKSAVDSDRKVVNIARHLRSSPDDVSELGAERKEWAGR